MEYYSKESTFDQFNCVDPTHHGMDQKTWDILLGLIKDFQERIDAKARLPILEHILVMVELERRHWIVLPAWLKVGANGIAYDLAKILVDMIFGRLKPCRGGGIQSEINFDLICLVSEACDEIDYLYSHVPRDISGSRRKKATLQVYEESGFNLVKQHHLECEDLYRFAKRQRSRDFKSKLLTKIMGEHGHVVRGRDFINQLLAIISTIPEYSKH